MRNLGTTAAGIAALAIAATLAGAALAGTTSSTTSSKKIVTFSAKYSGTAVTKVTDDIAAITATGSGTGLPIGAGKITGIGTGNTAVQPCVPLLGTGKMTGTARTTITFKVAPSSSGCGDEGGQIFSISGKAVVVKATGKLLKAKGTLKFTGVFDRSTGHFTVKFKGSLTI